MPDPVIIVAADPAWPELFERLRAPVALALGALAIAIEHVGSTSVPGLDAKPIIDMDVVIASRDDLPRVIAALAEVGYTHLGDLDVPGREAFRYRDHDPRRNLYVCAADSRELRRHLAFRDWLRTHPETAAAYADLKHALAIRHRDDRDAYSVAKTELIESVLQLTKG